MKHIFATILIVILIFSLTVTAFSEAKTETWNELGITLTYPEEFNSTKGIFMPFPYPTSKDGVYEMMFNYYAFSKEDSDRYNEKTKKGELSAEDTATILDAMGTMLVVLGIDGGRDAAALSEILEIEGQAEENFTLVGRHDDITYYALTSPDTYSDYVEKIPAEYAEEFLALQSALIEALKNAVYFTPQSTGSELMGTVLQFETTDLDGNTVKSEDLFAAHAVTMVNIWATWCGPCKNEMPELGDIARRIEADGKDAAIVGICNDADEELETCREILAERNAEYLNLLPFEDMMEILSLTTLPTTLFINREGVILLPPIKGVPDDLSTYESLIDAFLS